jgi:hypothetical protein
MGTKASRNRLRQREREFAAANPRFISNGKTLTPDMPEYHRVIREMAETLSDEEAAPLLQRRIPE